MLGVEMITVNLETVQKDNSISPVRVEGIDNVVDIAVGLNHTLLLTNTGDIYAFGDGSNHQVIPELTETALTPQNYILRVLWKLRQYMLTIIQVMHLQETVT